MNLILIETGELASAGEVTLGDARAVHLTRVLRVTDGQTVRVGLVDGPLGTGTVVRVAGGRVTLRCEFETVPPPRPRLDLLLALPRPKVLRRLWAQLAALGVGHVFLANAARVERDYFGSHVVTEPCYRPLLLEGLQQARDTRLPAVSVHRRLKVLIEDDLAAGEAYGARLTAHPGTGARVADALGRVGDARVLLAVGPEGGWTRFELELLARHGFRVASLSPRRLRVDTACLALVTLVYDTLGGAGG